MWVLYQLNEGINSAEVLEMKHFTGYDFFACCKPTCRIEFEKRS